MRLCKDCIWVRNPGEYAECVEPRNMEIDPATGHTIPRYKYCSTHRSDGWITNLIANCCGGRWFKQRSDK